MPGLGWDGGRGGVLLGGLLGVGGGVGVFSGSGWGVGGGGEAVTWNVGWGVRLQVVMFSLGVGREGRWRPR